MPKQKSLYEEFGKNTITIIPQEDGRVFAEIRAFPGCMAEGESVSDAIKQLKKSLCLWKEAMDAKD